MSAFKESPYCDRGASKLYEEYISSVGIGSPISFEEWKARRADKQHQIQQAKKFGLTVAGVLALTLIINPAGHFLHNLRWPSAPDFRIAPLPQILAGILNPVGGGAAGSWTSVIQHPSHTVTNSLTNTVTVSSTGAGHAGFLVATGYNGSESSGGCMLYSSVSGGGTWTQLQSAAQCSPDGGTNAPNNIIAWIPSLTGGVTSITMTVAVSGTLQTWSEWSLDFIEASYTGTPSFDVGNNLPTVACTSCAGAPLVLTGTNALIIQELNSHDTASAITGGAFTSPVFSAYHALASPQYAGVSVGTLNTSNVTQPTWTVATSNVAYTSAVVFDFGPTACSDQTLIDFSGGSNTGTVTNATMAASLHGVQGNMNTSGSMTYSTSAYQPLVNSFRACAGGSTGPASLGIDWPTASGIVSVTYTPYHYPVSNAWTYGGWFYTTVPNSDTGTIASINQIYGLGAGDYLDIAIISSGTTYLDAECESKGIANSSIAHIQPNQWYFLVTHYDETSNHTCQVFNSAGTSLGSVNKTPQFSGFHPSDFVIGATGDTVTSGYHFYFGPQKFDLTGGTILP